MLDPAMFSSIKQVIIKHITSNPKKDLVKYVEEFEFPGEVINKSDRNKLITTLNKSKIFLNKYFVDVLNS